MFYKKIFLLHYSVRTEVFIKHIYVNKYLGNYNEIVKCVDFSRDIFETSLNMIQKLHKQNELFEII